MVNILVSYFFKNRFIICCIVASIQSYCGRLFFHCTLA